MKFHNLEFWSFVEVARTKLSFNNFQEYFMTFYLHSIVLFFFNYNFFHFRQEYHFLFDDNFEIRDDIDILKEMGLVMGNDSLNN